MAKITRATIPTAVSSSRAANLVTTLLPGHLGQPERERQRRDDLGADFHGAERNRPEADVIAESLRDQRHGEPQQGDRPGHQGGARGPQAPGDQQACARGGDEAPSAATRNE